MLDDLEQSVSSTHAKHLLADEATGYGKMLLTALCQEADGAED
jgi:hypothetical protein